MRSLDQTRANLESLAAFVFGPRAGSRKLVNAPCQVKGKEVLANMNEYEMARCIAD